MDGGGREKVKVCVKIRLNIKKTTLIKLNIG